MSSMKRKKKRYWLLFSNMHIYIYIYLYRRVWIDAIELMCCICEDRVALLGVKRVLVLLLLLFFIFFIFMITDPSPPLIGTVKGK